MKKRLVSVFVLAILFLGILGAVGACSMANPKDNAALEMANFKSIDEERHLVYDKDTKVVYYMFSTFEPGGYSYSYFAPYISENGRNCRYIEGEIVEIIIEQPNTENKEMK